MKLTYKGYTGEFDWSQEDNCYFGKLIDINDLVTFESDTLKGIDSSFIDSVDDYIELCKEVGKDETEYLLNSPANAERLRKGIEEYEKGN